MRFTYCPHCGTILSERNIGDEGAAPYCEKCCIPLWETFTTSILAVVVNEFDEAALLRQSYVSATKYVCVAGIMKPGESAEEAVVREVREEIGQEVLSLEYMGSFPYEKRDMLMLGYKARVKKSKLQVSGEVDSAEWVHLKNALEKLREGSIGWQLMKKVLGEDQSEGVSAR